MDIETFTSEIKYQSIMATVKVMLEESIINEEDYAIIDTNMKEKYKPFLGSL